MIPIFHCEGFKKEEVRIRAGKHGRLLVSGERQVSNENKIIHFQQAFKVPLDSAVSETSGNLQDGTFYITIPKKQKHLNKPDFVEEQDQTIVAGKSEHKTEYNQNSEDQTMQENGVEEEDEFHDMMEDDQWSRRSVLEKNGICTVVIALSLGVIFAAYLCNCMNQGY